MRKLFINLALLSFLGLMLALPVQAQESFSTATVYYNEACGGCSIYLKEKLVPYLKDQGLVVTI